MTKQWVAELVQQQLSDYFAGHLEIYPEFVTQVSVEIAADEKGLLVVAMYKDGRSSQTLFVDNVDHTDLDDVVALTVEQLVENANVVAERIASSTYEPSPVPVPFPKVTHSRGPALNRQWEENWVPMRPIPSLHLGGRAQREATCVEGDRGNAQREQTVVSLAERVVEGKLDAAAAGRMMRSLVTIWKPATTWAERAERFHEAAIETDPNSFLHVLALKDAGVLNVQDFEAIRSALLGDE